jgi:hypothetical protein
MLKGKFSYMSPEQCQSLPLDRRSDVFSIGILLYELSTLSKLFRATSDFALLQQIAEARVPLPSTRVPGYPPELEHIVMKALAKEPGDRYPTAQALQLDLEELAREHKHAMSSVRIARLMAGMFVKRNDMWIRAQRTRHDSLDMLPTPAGTGNLPGFMADGSAPSAPGEDDQDPVADALFGAPGSVVGAVDAMSSAARPPRRSPALWLVGSAIAGMIAGAVSIADQMITGAADRAVTSAIAADVERIASVFDASSRSVHMRADGIATTPMLRAAIETDAETLRDLADTEMVLTVERAEALEVFQFRGDKVTSLLRIPNTAPAMQPIKGRATHARSDGRTVTLVASAPISGYRSPLAGGIVISTLVDLSAIRRGLDDHVVHASLRGMGAELVLVGPRAGERGAAVELPVASSGEWSTGNAMLSVTPKKAAGLIWAPQACAMSGGLSALLLLGFVVSLVRRPRS